jgi:hypothetical protein
MFAVPQSEAGEDPARCLTFALLWLDRLRQNASRKNVAGVRLLLPQSGAAPVAHLLSALHPALRLQLFERDPVLERLVRVEPSEAANFTSWIVAVREAQSLLDRARQEIDALLPASRQAISLHPNVPAKEVVVRFRGIACLRWRESGIYFGARVLNSKLEPGTAAAVQLFRELELRRHPLASDPRHVLYRTQAERWLEFLVRENVTRIDATLDSRLAYSQILAASPGEHGILDVLSVTRAGRLAILELKVVEHPVFLLQAAKYWLCVRRHLEQGDFARYGYFPGLMLQTQPPIVQLIAPSLLRFHPATGILLKYLHPQIEVTRVGLAESWRRGLRVVLRQ